MNPYVLVRTADTAESDEYRLRDTAKRTLPLRAARADVCWASVGALGNRPQR